MSRDAIVKLLSFIAGNKLLKVSFKKGNGRENPSTIFHLSSLIIHH